MSVPESTLLADVPRDARIVRDIEESAEYDESREQRVPPAGDTRTDAIARSAR